ncbi:hypothetical protein C7S18_13910 [Ahniella affigens]|uniref:Uncharacterized protein n=2 Tax=Ahniella affigens TaxID=2021234 RepID=A0A2P1PTQ3_9GAMM|nr:hypothetical protein C7S18_13910 [Ahniella affigens]
MFAAVLAVFAFVQTGSSPHLAQLSKTWNDAWSPVIGVATLIVAIFVWISELKEDWRESLPWKLSVRFVHAFPLPIELDPEQKEKPEKRDILVCRYASLSSLEDARNLAQQIGQQMGGMKHLSFNAAAIISDIKEIEQDANGAYFRHVCLEFTLHKIPDICIYSEQIESMIHADNSSEVQLAPTQPAEATAPAVAKKQKPVKPEFLPMPNDVKDGQAYLIWEPRLERIEMKFHQKPEARP